MKIYFAGILAGDEPIENRERDLYIFMRNRLISYFYVLNKAVPMQVIKEAINENR